MPCDWPAPSPRGIAGFRNRLRSDKTIFRPGALTKYAKVARHEIVSGFKRRAAGRRSAMDCSFCNTSAVPSARFCSHCGARLALAESSSNSPAGAEVLVDRRSFETMVALAPNMICVLDVLEKRYSYLNEAIVRFLGCTRDQLMAADGARLVVGRVHPEDLHRTISGHEELLRLSGDCENPDERHVEEFEYRLQRAGSLAVGPFVGHGVCAHLTVVSAKSWELPTTLPGENSPNTRCC